MATTIPITILSTATESDIIPLEGATLCGLLVPETVTGATLTLMGAVVDGTTMYTVKDVENNTFTITASGAPGFYPINPSSTQALRFVQLVSASAEGDQLDMYLVVRRF
jgi:hypothetical protein